MELHGRAAITFEMLSRTIKGNPLNFNGAFSGKTLMQPHFSRTISPRCNAVQTERERNREIKEEKK